MKRIWRDEEEKTEREKQQEGPRLPRIVLNPYD